MGFSMTEKVAYGVELRAKAGLWRGVIDQVERKGGSLGTYTSGQRVWRCTHEHRTEEAARACATRELRGPAEWVTAPDGEEFRVGQCQGHAACPVERHEHGCYADDETNCDHPDEHPRPRDRE